MPCNCCTFLSYADANYYLLYGFDYEFRVRVTGFDWSEWGNEYGSDPVSSAVDTSPDDDNVLETQVRVRMTAAAFVPITARYIIGYALDGYPDGIPATVTYEGTGDSVDMGYDPYWERNVHQYAGPWHEIDVPATGSVNAPATLTPEERNWFYWDSGWNYSTGNTAPCVVLKVWPAQYDEPPD
jgi:hypothetical protein